MSDLETSSEVECLLAALRETQWQLSLSEHALARHHAILARLQQDRQSAFLVKETCEQFEKFVALCAATVTRIEDELAQIETPHGTPETVVQGGFQPGVDFSFDLPAEPLSDTGNPR